MAPKVVALKSSSQVLAEYKPVSVQRLTIAAGTRLGTNLAALFATDSAAMHLEQLVGR